jgi:outer membrane protein assembly factor BamB
MWGGEDLGRFRAGLVSGVWVLLVFVAVFSVVLNVPVVSSSGSSWVWVGDTVTGAYGEAVAGTGEDIYIARGTSFYRYRPADGSWMAMASPPKPDGSAFKTGTALAWDSGNYIYALFGAASGENHRWFYRYSISGNSWEALANTPADQGEGDAIAWVSLDSCIYATIGGEQRSTYFVRYDPSTNTWSDAAVADPPAGMGDGASLVWTGNNYLYALRGEFYETTALYDFWRYDLTTDTWTYMVNIPADPHDGGVGGVGDGGSLLYIGLWNSSQTDFIYALGGNQAYPESIPDNRFYRYTISSDTWERLADLPFGVGYYVGNRLGYAKGHIYAWQGTPSTWAGGGDDLAQYNFPQVPKTDWPMLGGNPQHTGLSMLKGKPSLPSKLWGYELKDWPVGASIDVGGPAIGDMNGDGANEVVMSFERVVQVLSGENGQKIWEFTTLNDIRSTPAIGDINGDGNNEVVVASTDGFVYALNGSDGSLLWDHETKKTNVAISPIVADMNSDGAAEVLVGQGYDLGGVTALNGRTGEVIWTSEYSDTASPAVDDITGDGQLEVVVAGAWNIYLLNGTNGNIIWKYKFWEGTSRSPYTPVIADVTGDGRKEIIIGFTDNYIEVLHASNGTILWKKNLGGYPYGYPIGDINKDGRYDIVALGQQGIIFALDGLNGTTLWMKDIGGSVSYPPVIVDINGDGLFEILVALRTSGLLLALNGTNGEEVWSYSIYVVSHIAVANVLADGEAEIILGTWSGNYEGVAVLGWAKDTTPPVTTISLSGVLGDNGWFTSNVTVTLSATDDTEVDKTEYSFDNTTWITYATPFTIAKEGNTIVYYKSIDNASNPEAIKTKTIKVDKAIPSSTIIIDNEANYTNSLSVILTLSADDATSGVAQMHFSHDNITWTPWEAYFTSKTWVLTTGDGTKTVYVQSRDKAGLISPSYQDIIILDATKPTANAGNDQTVNEDTIVTFDGSASQDENGIQSHAWTFTDVTSQTLTGRNPTYTFATPGTYTITLKVSDPAGNTATATITITVLPSEAPPPPPAEAFPMWIIGAAFATIAIAALVTILLRRRK